MSNKVRFVDNLKVGAYKVLGNEATLPSGSSAILSSLYANTIESPDVNLSGSFSGSFQGDGSGLENIPASAITGLNLNQISSGSVSASISPNNGLQTNTNLDVSGSIIADSFIRSGSTSDDILLGDGSTTALSVLTGSTGGTPAGADTEVQFNDGGSFGASSAFTYSITNNQIEFLSGVDPTKKFTVGSYGTGHNSFFGINADEILYIDSATNREINIRSGRNIILQSNTNRGIYADIGTGDFIWRDRNDGNAEVARLYASTGNFETIGSVKTNTLESDEGVDIPEGIESLIFRDGGSQGSVIYNPEHNMISGGGVTGYLRILTPLVEGNNYCAFTIDLEISGQYRTTTKLRINVRWLTTGFDILRAYSVSGDQANYVVRAGKDGGGLTYIIVGETDTSWDRDFINIEKVTVNYVYEPVQVFKQGWSLSINASLPAGFIQQKIVNNTDLISTTTGLSSGTANVGANTWHTIAKSTSTLSYEGDIVLKRLDQVGISISVSKSYNRETLKVNWLNQLSTDAIKGVRITSDEKVQIQWGGTYSGTQELWLSGAGSGKLQLANEVALIGDTADKSIDLTGIVESGERHAQNITVQGNVNADGFVTPSGTSDDILLADGTTTSLSGITAPTETATYSATNTGTVTLDCDTFNSTYRILTGNTDFQFSNTPASGETFVKTIECITTAGESLTFTTSDKVIGTFVNDDTTVNIITVNFANYPTLGLRITVMINQ